MISVRIESQGHVLKYKGRNWTVGKVNRRKIKGVMADEVLQPKYFDNAWRAIVNFGCRVRESGGSELPLLLFQILPVLRPMKASSLLLLTRQHSGLSKSHLARLSGVSRSTIKSIENSSTNPRTDTFWRLMRAMTGARSGQARNPGS